MPLNPEKRRAALAAWLGAQLGVDAPALRTVCGDASQRRYYRVTLGGVSRVAMDSPPELENPEPYVRIAARLREAGLHAPEVLAHDLEQGFLLLEDLGDTTYLQLFERGGDPEQAYRDAIGALVHMQSRLAQLSNELPEYDAAMLRAELALFPEWLLAGHLGIKLDPGSAKVLSRSNEWLVEQLLVQPRVFVHRDYHSRNLMYCRGVGNPGVLDFQGAVCGPIGYDLVSLLRDCYVVWDPARIDEWIALYRDRAERVGLPVGTERDFQKWFDLAGVQRHLKASGIFARLAIRDGKTAYVSDIPRTLRYVCDVAPLYPPLRPLAKFVASKVMPNLVGKSL